MVGGNAAAASASATMAATLFLAAMLTVSMALLTAAPRPPSPPSRENGLRSGWTKQQGLREMGGGVGDGGYRRVLPRRQRSLAGETDFGGVHARVVPRLFPLASAKRQVPTGADPIHHNERPPSLPHHRRHLP